MPVPPLCSQHTAAQGAVSLSCPDGAFSFRRIFHRHDNTVPIIDEVEVCTTLFHGFFPGAFSAD